METGLKVKHNIKMNLTEISCKGVECVAQAQDVV
jgi:hypothetical protein